jgi:hypothetical protein
MDPRSQVHDSGARAARRSSTGELQRARVCVVALGARELARPPPRFAGRELGEQQPSGGVERVARAAPPPRRCRARHDTVISPRVEVRVAARAERELASVPRYTVSNTFVSSRATAARRVGPNACACPRATPRCDAAPRRNTCVRVSGASSASRARRSASRAGRNPSKETLGRQARDAERRGDGRGPGTATSRPASRHAAYQFEARVRSNGVPASLTSATRAPPRSFSSNSPIALRLVVLVQRHQGRESPSVVSNCPSGACPRAATSSRGGQLVARAAATGHRDCRWASR